MASHSLTSSFLAVLVLLTSLLTCLTCAQSCNTDQNPYCRGNSQFEQICCPPGNICYWSNRNGDPACCQAGSDCRGDGGPGPVVITSTPNPTTLVISTSQYTTSYCPPTTTTSYYITTTSQWNQWYSSSSYYTTSYYTTPTYTTPVTVTVTQGQPTQPNGVVVGATVTQVQYVSAAILQHSAASLALMALSTATFLVTLLAL